jgi:hypothetical protein
MRCYTPYAIQATSDEFASTSVENPLQISPFMQNKPNFLDALMNVNKVLTKNYENKTLGRRGKNKANQSQYKPNQSQYNANQSQYKPNTNPIQSQFQRQKVELGRQ